MINWTTTRDEDELIRKICERYEEETNAAKEDRRYKRGNLMMDLAACHGNGNPLDLAKLLTAPTFDFLHDISGISVYIDRGTGKLTQCFSPRCSVHEVEATA